MSHRHFGTKYRVNPRRSTPAQCCARAARLSSSRASPVGPPNRRRSQAARRVFVWLLLKRAVHWRRAAPVSRSHGASPRSKIPRFRRSRSQLPPQAVADDSTLGATYSGNPANRIAPPISLAYQALYGWYEGSSGWMALIFSSHEETLYAGCALRTVATVARAADACPALA